MSLCGQNLDEVVMQNLGCGQNLDRFGCTAVVRVSGYVRVCVCACVFVCVCVCVCVWFGVYSVCVLCGLGCTACVAPLTSETRCVAPLTA